MAPNVALRELLQPILPDPDAVFEQLPELLAESLHARRTARMARGSEELSAMDDDPERSLRRVASMGLNSWWIPSPLPSRLDTLLIGASLGVFSHDAQVRVDDESLARIRKSTPRALQELGYAKAPALIVEWDSLHSGTDGPA